MKKTHADKIREAVTDLGTASPREIMDWIERHYPDDDVNPKSYRSDIIGCSVNHSSSFHYPSMPKFLWYDAESKTYKLANPDKEVSLSKGKIETLPVSNESQLIIGGIPLSKLSVTGQVHIPSDIREKLRFQVGDFLSFVINDEGVLEIRKARLQI